ncbi:hypothetical protein GCM10011394_01420 [Luteimonas terricola]|uniref:Uncharacterized protein n=1 Tax=Luteimonas terricola TaxID=645597 RepID=A0ABQ2E6H8_9GAMM|nr:hypothetical protein GCM10011394_01420 [Luteimonas terricola]
MRLRVCCKHGGWRALRMRGQGQCRRLPWRTGRPARQLLWQADRVEDLPRHVPDKAWRPAVGARRCTMGVVRAVKARRAAMRVAGALDAGRAHVGKIRAIDAGGTRNVGEVRAIDAGGTCNVG